MFHTVTMEGYVSHRPMLLFSTFQGRICFTPRKDMSNVTI